MTESAERHTRTRENTRQRLLDAAAEVYAEIGVDAASVEMITERAGFTRGAFYSNFESKDELFFELMRSANDRKLGAVGSRVRELGDRDDVQALPVDQILALILDSIVDNPRDIRLLAEFRTRAMRDERTAEAYLAWQSVMEERMREIVSEVTRATGITLQTDAGELAQSVFFIWEGTSVHGVIAGRPADELRETVRRRTLAIVTAAVSGAGTR